MNLLGFSRHDLVGHIFPPFFIQDLELESRSPKATCPLGRKVRV